MRWACRQRACYTERAWPNVAQGAPKRRELDDGRKEQLSGARPPPWPSLPHRSRRSRRLQRRGQVRSVSQFVLLRFRRQPVESGVVLAIATRDVEREYHFVDPLAVAAHVIALAGGLPLHS